MGDASWKLGILGSSFMVGCGLIDYVNAIRDGDNMRSQFMGHICCFLGAALLFYFLFRGHGFRDGNKAMFAIKMGGLCFGMATTTFFIAALSNVSAEDGTNLQMSDLYEQSQTSFNLALSFGVVTLILIIFVNLKHLGCRKVEGGNWYNSPYMNGIYNTGLLAAVGAGTCILGDISHRFTQDVEVNYPSFLAAGACLLYLLTYIMIKMIWQKGDVIYKGLMLFSAVGITGSLFALIDAWQDIGGEEVSKEIFNQQNLATWGFCGFLALGLFCYLKMSGKLRSKFCKGQANCGVGDGERLRDF